MLRFLLRRLGAYLALTIVASSAAYLLAAATLNPRARYEQRSPPPPPAVVDATLTASNLNDKTPVFRRYLRWVGGMAHGDLGRSVDGTPIRAQLPRRIGVTARLLVAGTLLGVTAGVLAGAAGAIWHRRLP